MTDAELREACAAIVANIREHERARLIAEAERSIYGADWFQRGVRRHLRLVEKPKLVTISSHDTVADRVLSMLGHYPWSSSTELATWTGLTLQQVCVALNKLHRKGRITRRGKRRSYEYAIAEAMAAE